MASLQPKGLFLKPCNHSTILIKIFQMLPIALGNPSTNSYILVLSSSLTSHYLASCHALIYFPLVSFSCSIAHLQPVLSCHSLNECILLTRMLFSSVCSIDSHIGPNSNAFLKKGFPWLQITLNSLSHTICNYTALCVTIWDGEGTQVSFCFVLPTMSWCTCCVLSSGTCLFHFLDIHKAGVDHKIRILNCRLQ